MLVYVSMTCFCYLLLFMGRMAPPVKVKGPTKQWDTEKTTNILTHISIHNSKYYRILTETDFFKKACLRKK